MFHTVLSRWYSKQIQFRLRTFAKVWVYYSHFLTEDVFRCVRSFVLRRLGCFRFATRCIDRSPEGSTPIMAFRSKCCPVYFNLDLGACLTFCPSMTSDVRFRPVFKASRPKFWLLSFIKERLILTDFRCCYPVRVLSDNVFQRTRVILFLPVSSSTRDAL